MNESSKTKKGDGNNDNIWLASWGNEASEV
jgi:hypothetical protein